MAYIQQHPFLPQAPIIINDNNNNPILIMNTTSDIIMNDNVSMMNFPVPWVIHTSAWDATNHPIMASIVLTVLCPLILFALMIIFLSSFTHMSGKTQGNASAFAMANVLRRFFTGATTTGGVGAPRFLSLLFVIIASLIIIYFDAIFKHHHDADNDDNPQAFQPLRRHCRSSSSSRGVPADADDEHQQQQQQQQNNNNDDDDLTMMMNDADDETVVFRRGS